MRGEAITLREEIKSNGMRLTYVVGGWPDEASIDPAFMWGAPAEYMAREGSKLRLTVMNGHAVYEVEPMRSGETYHRLHKISASLIS